MHLTQSPQSGIYLCMLAMHSKLPPELTVASSNFKPNMSRSEVSCQELRKRASSNVLREDQQSRKKFAHATNASDSAMTEAKVEIAELRGQISNREAQRSERWIERKPRVRRRDYCCACNEGQPLKDDNSCRGCGHVRCPECMIKDQVSRKLSLWVCRLRNISKYISYTIS